MPADSENSSNKLAPIVVFCYARPDHLYSTLKALAENDLADQSKLYIFSDGAKGETDSFGVSEVRSLARRISGFSEIQVIEREKNYGLARNIVAGVTEILSKYGKAIILEDDILVSSDFLEFMNDALERYKDDRRVWHVSGWNYPISSNRLPDCFFWRGMNCWGWGTWKDRWQQIELDPASFVERMTESDIHCFNIDSSYNFWKQMLKNYNGDDSTWAIFWYATIFRHHGLCLNPTYSMVHNIGFDGSGENCGNTGLRQTKNVGRRIERWPELVVENEIAISRIKRLVSRRKSRFLIRVLRQLIS